MSNIPSALDALPEILARGSGKRVVVFLDYDGTLTPIAARPDQALLEAGMREVVRRLAEEVPLAIVSGRDRADVENLIGLPGLYIAGSHGFDIAAPDGRRLPVAQAGEFPPLLREAEAEIQAAVAEVPGVLIESKAYAFAVHYRQVEQARHTQLGENVAAVAARYPSLQVKEGKRVYEFLPALDWHKGKAVTLLLETMLLETVQNESVPLESMLLEGAGDQREVLPLYIGDDHTDEDAFAEVRGAGVGILVAEAPRPTAAAYRLRDVAAVREFLERLTDWLEARE